MEMFLKMLKDNLLVIVLIVLCIFLGVKGCRIKTHIDDPVISKNDSTNKTTVIYTEADFKALKQQNKELYDSLKDCKNEIDYLLRFKYKKEYDTGVVEIRKTTVHDTLYLKDGSVAELKDSLYEYDGGTDTLSYKLQVYGPTEPEWYRLKYSLNEVFTIVDKKNGDIQETVIGTQNGGDISGITIYKPKEKRSFWKRFSVGPTISAGYDVVNNKFGVQVGVGVGFDLIKK